MFNVCALNFNFFDRVSNQSQMHTAVTFRTVYDMHMSVCKCDVSALLQGIRTEQYDDADKYGDDGSCSQACGCHGPERGAVPVLVAGTHLHFDD